jgi:hypothetical protein
LDRGLANQDWIQIFPNSLLNHFPAFHSDHCPILLSYAGTYMDLPKPFRFEAFWTRDLSSFSIVTDAWHDCVVGSPAFSLSKKWKNTKSALKFWNKHHFGHIQTCIKSPMANIVVNQSAPHFVVNVGRKTLLQGALQEQLLREEVLWKQTSREIWLSCSDLNTKFFHATVACRRRYNSIYCLRAADGSNLLSRENIGSFLVDHFSTLFSSSNPILDDSFFDLVSPVITAKDNVVLCSILKKLKFSLPHLILALIKVLVLME